VHLSSQIKVTLSPHLYEFIQKRAHLYGLTASMYIRHLILADVKGLEVPDGPIVDPVEGINDYQYAARIFGSQPPPIQEEPPF
jgi:hypothetical protein